MKYAIVYSSQTGNTKLLAKTVQSVLPGMECIYFGFPSPEALTADRIYIGFWTDKGSCDKNTKDFLKKLTNQEVYLFGTAGFGDNQKYFKKITLKAEKYLDKNVAVIGRFMCQGKMPLSVRQKYEKMQSQKIKIPGIQRMIENFDKALTHPDEQDIDALKKDVRLTYPHLK